MSRREPVVVPMVDEQALSLGEGLKIRLVRVTPQMAFEWLRRNCENNRNPIRSRIKQYAADMKAGRWNLSDQPITFDEKGELVNGRNRLEACVSADTPFLSLVLQGLPEKSFLSLDGGKKRTTDDNMKMAGREWPRGCGATVRRIFLGTRSYAGRAYTDQEVDVFMMARGEAVVFAHRVLPKGKSANASTRAVVTRAKIIGRDDRRLEDFGRVMATGLMVPGDEGAVLLRNAILEGTQSRGGDRQNLYALAETALAAFLKGDAVKDIKMAKRELFPIPDEGYWDAE